MKPWLKLDAAVAGYDRPVVGPVSLTLGPGEVLGLAGRNGVGKSTLMAAILGEARLYQGRLWRAEDVLVAHLPQRLIRPHGIALNAREWLRFMGAQARLRPKRLETILDQRIDRLSGGEYQLLNLWGVLAIGAGIVLLDEPTNNLDPQHVELAAALIGSDGDQRTLLVISHDQAFLERVCTRVMRLEA